MAKKKANAPKSISNRRASFDYNLGDSLIVGIELTGAETKSLRLGQGHIRGAYVTIKDNELYLINATITGNNGMPIQEQDQTRARKLLAKRKEIDALILAKQGGKTIVPLSIFTGSRYIKLKIAIGTGKKKYDKRESLKRKTQEREAQRIARL
jgi:SsrA-binding protein